MGNISWNWPKGKENNIVRTKVNLKKIWMTTKRYKKKINKPRV